LWRVVAVKSILQKVLGRPIRLSAPLWKHFSESKLSAPYLVSCLTKPTILYVSPRFDDITGYSREKFISGGLAFWFSVIHPADMQGVVAGITKAQHDLITIDPRPIAPLKLEYRITKPDGRVVWVREFKQIISYKDGKKDHVLGCLHDITAEKADEQASAQRVLNRDKAANGLLDIAVSYQLKDASDRRKVGASSPNRISSREKQVLRLVAEGYSSKQIAAELAISENTVETHRRHLLQKFKVNNSTALVKEAHRRCLV
jgi:PAS domain S-box-containing protein